MGEKALLNIQFNVFNNIAAGSTIMIYLPFIYPGDLNNLPIFLLNSPKICSGINVKSF